MDQPPLGPGDALRSSVRQTDTGALRSPSSAIPATPEEQAGAPCPGTTVPRGSVHAAVNDFPSFLDVALPQPSVLPPSSAETPFWLDDHHQQIELDFAAALPSTNVSLPTSTVIKTAHSLRLPSFDELGIAAPHPDQFPLQPRHSFTTSEIGAGPLSKPEDPLHALSPPLNLRCELAAAESLTRSPRAERSQLERVVATFTPPSEPGTFHWGAVLSMRPGELGSPPNSVPGVSPNINLTASATAPGQAPIIVPTSVELSDALSMAAWIGEAKDTISEYLKHRVSRHN